MSPRGAPPPASGARRGRAAALALVPMLSVPAPSSLRETVLVVDQPWRRVGMTVTVVDRQGRPVRGLARGDFRLSEDGVAVPIEEFAVEGERRDVPLSVAVLLDLSGSMGSQIREVGEAAAGLVRGLRPGDEVAVAKFNDQITVLQPFTGDPAAAFLRLETIGRAWGGTALFRSIGEILRDLRDRPGRKVILVVSDGLDSYAGRGGHVLQSAEFQDLLRLCFRSRTVVYGIRPGMQATSWLPFESFVEHSGGRLLYTGIGLPRLFARLGEEFAQQYHIGWDIDPKARRGRHRALRVEVARPDVVVKAMAGFTLPRPRAGFLLRALRADDAHDRADAAYELGFVDDARASSALVAALADDDAGVRRTAALALGRLGEAEALAPLLARLGDPAPEVRTAAGRAIALFGPGAIPAIAEEAARPRPPGPSDAALLIAGLLGELGDERALPPLGVLARAPEAATRAAAAAALGRLGLSGAAPILHPALEDVDPAVRAAAAGALAAAAGRAARPALEARRLGETDAAVRRAIDSALASLE